MNCFLSCVDNFWSPSLVVEPSKAASTSLRNPGSVLDSFPLPLPAVTGPIQYVRMARIRDLPRSKPFTMAAKNDLEKGVIARKILRVSLALGMEGTSRECRYWTRMSKASEIDGTSKLATWCTGAYVDNGVDNGRSKTRQLSRIWGKRRRESTNSLDAGNDRTGK